MDDSLEPIRIGSVGSKFQLISRWNY